MSRFTKQVAFALFTNVQSGIDKHIAADVMIDGTVYSPTALKGVFGDAIARMHDVSSLLERYHDAVLEQAEATDKALLTFELLRGCLIGQYGKQANAVLGDFGMVIPKQGGAKTIAAKAQAIASRALTRVMRHTLGRDQEKAVTGRIEIPNPALPAAESAAARKEVK